ncbi:glycosyltransferase family 4 protein [Candidatus Zixiibacteriota bacterium]
MRRLQICLISQQFGEVKSGVGVYTRNVANRLLDDDHNVTLICPREKASRDIPGLQLELVSGQGTGSSHVRWLSLSRRFGRALRALRQRRRFDLVHFTDAREALLCPLRGTLAVGNMNDYYFAAASRNPWAFRADYIDWGVRWAYYNSVRFLERRALKKLTAVICNSRYTREKLAGAYHLAAEKLPVIYKSIDLSRYDFQPSPGDQDDPRILFIGGNVQRKGLPTLVRAATVILEALPGAIFVVVGDNQNLGAMKDLCRRSGVAESFQFLGWQSHDQIQKHYHGASVFVMPSLIEAFGVVFLEAMAMGVPVIGGDVGGTRELIQDGINGLLVPARDHRALARKVLLVLQDETVRRDLVQNGLKTVREYGVAKMVEETYALYEKLLG